MTSLPESIEVCTPWVTMSSLRKSIVHRTVVAKHCTVVMNIRLHLLQQPTGQSAVSLHHRFLSLAHALCAISGFTVGFHKFLKKTLFVDGSAATFGKRVHRVIGDETASLESDPDLAKNLAQIYLGSTATFHGDAVVVPP